MRAFYIAVCVFCIIYGSINNSHAMRCKGKLLVRGDSIVRLVANCGTPIYSEVIIKNNRIMKLFVYKKKYGREKRVFVYHGVIIGVK
jgi:hypothetical protein